MLDKNLRKIKRSKKIFNVVKNNADYCISVFKSNKNIYAQIIDLKNNHILTAASSLDKSLADVKENKTNISYKVGEIVGDKIIKLKLDKAILAFNRKGYKYHGRIKSLAEGIRNKGIKI